VRALSIDVYKIQLDAVIKMSGGLTPGGGVKNLNGWCRGGGLYTSQSDFFLLYGMGYEVETTS